MTNSAHSKYAGAFLLAGICMTYGLMFLMTAKSPFSGMGDGTDHFDSPSPAELVLPYSAYFLCGLIAACSSRRWMRMVAAVIAHAAPMVSFAFADPPTATAFIFIDLVTFAAFGFTWFQMLKKETTAA